jgi:hypothetical protein
MAKRFDLTILPIYQEEGEILPEMPGLYVASPPRRAARRRSAEHLVLHLSMEGNAPLSPKTSRQILSKLSDVFYKTDGATTSALREVSDTLNRYLHDRNLRGSAQGVRGIGFLTQVVLRADKLIFAQSGGSYIYIISPDQIKEMHDTDLAGPGLGASRVPKVRYYQKTLVEHDFVLITPQPPSPWSETTLKNLHRMKMKSIYHRLVHRVEDDLNVLLLAPQEGSGNIKVIRPIFVDEEEGEVLERESLPEEGELHPQDEEKKPIPQALSALKAGIWDRESTPESISEEGVPYPAEPEVEEERPSPEEVAVKETPGFFGKVADWPLWSLLGTMAHSIGNAFQVLWQNITTLLARMLPDEKYLDFPSWVLGLIAVIIPVIIVSFGSVIYIRRGRNSLYETTYQEAQSLMEIAERTENPEEYYQTLSAAMEKIDQARQYRETEEVEGLYDQIRLELDRLDKITRLSFEPLFSHGLGPDVNISEMVVTAWNDLYMLNENDGTVIWAQYNADGYQIKDQFHCGPISGHKTVGPLVDIVPLSATQEEEATLLGIDRSHTMIFCFSDADEPPVMFEDTSYTLARGPVEAMTISTNAPENIYILDPEKRAIWIEYQSQNYHAGSEYFGDIDAPTMEDAIDLATNGSELYLLHADGYITKCVKESPQADPQCETPFEFSDPREGHPSGPFMTGAQFNAIKFKGSPGMAIYMLDSDHQALYRFSTQMEYQRQFRPTQGLISGPVTAFSVTMSDRVYLAVGNQVYTAQLIP